MRVLLDAGIFIHAEFARPSVRQPTGRWGGAAELPPVHGLIRKPRKKNQEEIDALFTVGRLIREGILEAYDYLEIRCELWRGTPSTPEFNALRGCVINHCAPAIDRSKFRSTIDFVEMFAKGGKKDMKRGKKETKNGIKLGSANQLAFLTWLCNLNKKELELLMSHTVERRQAPFEVSPLTPFEMDSLRDIEWFQFLCQRSSKENYLDLFHLWTARRNHLDAILVLDSDLPELISRIAREKSKQARNFQITTEVLYPLALLQRLEIGQPDAVPMEFDHFYHQHEAP